MALGDFCGFGINGFASFGGGELQRIGPMESIHLLAGRNNVGKSNALRAVRAICAMGSGTLAPGWGGDDLPLGWFANATRTGFSVCLRLTPAVQEKLGLKNRSKEEPNGPWEALSHPAFTRGDKDVVWLDYEVVPGQGNPVPSRKQFDEARGVHHIFAQWPTMRGQFGLDPFAAWSEILRIGDPLSLRPPTTAIDAVRAIAEGTDESDDVYTNGRGLLRSLFRLQVPGNVHTFEEDEARWDSLQEFVRNVLEDSTARLSIPYTQDDLFVQTRHRRQPYRRLGTGIAEIVHIAAVATVHSGYLITIEEPELHLHPALQRKLLQFLWQDARNHYLIATHSAQMLDSEVASISHLALSSEGWTEVTAVDMDRKRAVLAADLGNRPSDLVQANYLIWVEGPSDRLYINHWIHGEAPDLVEGAHYSVMFYGGALLSHLTVEEDQEVNDFIELSRINQSPAMLIDSDASGPGTNLLNATKRRVLKEFKDRGAFTWVTQGYTVESLVDPAVLQEVIVARYKRAYTVPTDRWVSPLGSTFDGGKGCPNKVTVARDVCKRSFNWSDFRAEVQPEVKALVKAIREASGLPTVSEASSGPASTP